MPSSHSRLLTTSEAAARAGFTYSSWLRLRARGQTPPPDALEGRQARYQPESVDRWLADRGGKGSYRLGSAPSVTPQRLEVEDSVDDDLNIVVRVPHLPDLVTVELLARAAGLTTRQVHRRRVHLPEPTKVEGRLIWQREQVLPWLTWHLKEEAIELEELIADQLHDEMPDDTALVGDDTGEQAA